MGGAASLIDHFGVTLGSVVAICGSGGKTTLLYRLAGEAAERGWKAVGTLGDYRIGTGGQLG